MIQSDRRGGRLQRRWTPSTVAVEESIAAYLCRDGYFQNAAKFRAKAAATGAVAQEVAASSRLFHL